MHLAPRRACNAPGWRLPTLQAPRFCHAPLHLADSGCVRGAGRCAGRWCHATPGRGRGWRRPYAAVTAHPAGWRAIHETCELLPLFSKNTVHPHAHVTESVTACLFFLGDMTHTRLLACA